MKEYGFRVADVMGRVLEHFSKVSTPAPVKASVMLSASTPAVIAPDRILSGRMGRGASLAGIAQQRSYRPSALIVRRTMSGGVL